jgi:hypothetical protein
MKAFSAEVFLYQCTKENKVLRCVDKKCVGFLSYIFVSCTYTAIHARYVVQDNGPLRTRIFLEDYSLIMERFACTNDPEKYVGGSVSCLAGSPMPDRPKGRSQTKCSPWSSRLGLGLPPPRKHSLLRNHGGRKE